MYERYKASLLSTFGSDLVDAWNDLTGKHDEAVRMLHTLIDTREGRGFLTTALAPRVMGSADIDILKSVRSDDHITFLLPILVDNWLLPGKEVHVAVSVIASWPRDVVINRLGSVVDAVLKDEGAGSQDAQHLEHLCWNLGPKAVDKYIDKLRGSSG